ncbi:MAG: hypothetical protein QGD94_11630, partial [Planctomycetia bacterium]|nr:hypothetical protein [Planctomycetia bacterium]
MKRLTLAAFGVLGILMSGSLALGGPEDGATVTAWSVDEELSAMPGKAIDDDPETCYGCDWKGGENQMYHPQGPGYFGPKEGYPGWLLIKLARPSAITGIHIVWKGVEKASDYGVAEYLRIYADATIDADNTVSGGKLLFDGALPETARESTLRWPPVTTGKIVLYFPAYKPGTRTLVQRNDVNLREITLLTDAVAGVKFPASPTPLNAEDRLHAKLARVSANIAVGKLADAKQGFQAALSDPIAGKFHGELRAVRKRLVEAHGRAGQADKALEMLKEAAPSLKGDEDWYTWAVCAYDLAKMSKTTAEGIAVFEQLSPHAVGEFARVRLGSLKGYFLAERDEVVKARKCLDDLLAASEPVRRSSWDELRLLRLLLASAYGRKGDFGAAEAQLKEQAAVLRTRGEWSQWARCALGPAPKAASTDAGLGLFDRLAAFATPDE